ncbi:hypothetical protein PFISCL1PPCAC_4292, partial [Pristionchus fissidentatus]
IFGRSVIGGLLTIETETGTVTETFSPSNPVLQCVPAERLCMCSSSITTTTTVSVSFFVPACCPVGGIWSEWTTTGACPTTCGSCRTATRKRTCTTAATGCPCTGPAADTGPCGIALCPHPSGTCC